jgi:hypothetical protein
MRRYLIALILLAFCFGLAPHRTAAESARPALYAGGVAGIKDLLDPANSTMFRAAGGGLYIHNSGWAKLTPEERQRILQVFQGRPVAVELGFRSGAAWGGVFKSNYLAYGIRPTFIAANAFANNNHPTPDQWRAYSAMLRAAGAPTSTLILPTFEYQNFRSNMNALSNNKISSSPVFQGIVEVAGGIVLDTPSLFAMKRESAYRDWVIDALHWTNRHRFVSVVILSPEHSGTNWGNDTLRYVRFLHEHAATPSVFVCENYNPTTSPSYPNMVGSERVSYNALGNCELIRTSR